MNFAQKKLLIFLQIYKIMKNNNFYKKFNNNRIDLEKEPYILKVTE